VRARIISSGRPQRERASDPIPERALQLPGGLQAGEHIAIVAHGANYVPC
jgi:hypothetical protein